MSNNLFNLTEFEERDQPALLEQALALLDTHYGTFENDIGERERYLSEETKEVMRQRFMDGDGIIVISMNDAGDVVTGASFSIFHQGDAVHPPVGMYVYEYCPRGEKSDLLEASIEALRQDIPVNAPILYEGTQKSRRHEETRGWRTLKYDEEQEDGVKWSGGEDILMVHGDTPPSLAAMEAAIYLQRNFVAQCYGEPIDLHVPIAQQMTNPEILEEYETTEAIEHACNMAENGKMKLEEPALTRGQVKRNRTHSR